MPSPKWEPLLTWTFRGGRFEKEKEEGIDLRDLEELSRLRVLLLELAKAVWYADNPDRKHLSPNAEESVELRLFGARAGSCEVVVHWAPPRPEQAQLFGDTLDERKLAAKLPAAAIVLAEAVRVVASGGELPEWFPLDLRPKLAEIGDTLSGEERFSLEVAGVAGAIPDPVGASQAERPSTTNDPSFRGVYVRPLADAARVARAPSAPVEVDAAARALLGRVTADPPSVSQTLSGEVTMASVKGKATLLLEDGEEVPLEFDHAKESEITRALHQHAIVRLRVRGLADVDFLGNLRKLRVEQLRVVDAPAETDEDRFARIGADAPEDLANMILSGTLKSTELTFAAEARARLLRTSPCRSCFRS